MTDRPTLIPALVYRDPRAALAWLEKAFGFEIAMVIEDDAREIVHSEMRHGDCLIMVGREWDDDYKSPINVSGKNTQSLHIHIVDDIHAHFERAKAAGATIIAEPQEQFYGDAVYRCRDLEGHIWTVGKTVKAVSREEAEAATGLKISGWV